MAHSEPAIITEHMDNTIPLAKERCFRTTMERLTD